MAPASFTELIALYDSKADEHEGKAKEYRMMSSNLRRDLAAFGITDKGLVSAPIPLPPKPKTIIIDPVSPQRVRDIVRRKGGRIKHVAKWLDVTEEQVAAVVKDPANGIRDKGRGWLELAPEHSPTGTTPILEKPA